MILFHGSLNSISEDQNLSHLLKIVFNRIFIQHFNRFFVCLLSIFFTCVQSMNSVLHCKYIQFLIVSTFHCNLTVQFTFFAVYSPSYSKKTVNQFTIILLYLEQQLPKCKPYSETTLESRTL